VAAASRGESPGAAGALLAAIGAVGFSGKAILIKLAYFYPVDAVTLLALRMLMSLPFFLFMALLSGRNPGYSLERGDWGAILGLGFLGYYLASYLDFLGLQYISAGLERLILFLYPTMVLAISALVLKLPVTRRHVAALGLSYGGIMLVFADNVRLAGDVAGTALGSLLVFGSALSYAVYLVWGGQVITRLGSVRFTAYAMTVASVLCIIQFAFTHPWSALVLPAPVYGYGFLMAVLSTVLPVWATSEGIRRIGASRAALVGAIGPVSTLFLANLFLDEPITAPQLAGAGLVLVGVLLLSLKVGTPPARS
jgi:drug/metabolite transporter (DMT)-like permease